MATPTRSSERTGARGVSAWFRRYGEEQARAAGKYAKKISHADRVEYIARKRAERLATLNKTAKEVRSFFKGFSAKDGYSLNDIRRWRLQDVRELEKYGEYLRHLKSQPHVRFVPITKKQKISVQTLTGQNDPSQRAYVIHKTHPDELVMIDEYGMVAIERKVSDKVGWIRAEFYYFRTFLNFQPLTWDEVYAATGELLPWLPEGEYFIYSSLHGEIDVPQPKRSLARIIQRYMQEYSQKDFASTIVGFRRIADEVNSDAEYEKIYTRRQKEKKRRKKEFDALMKKVARPLKKKAKRKPK